MPGSYELANLVRNLIWSFQQALVYCISELLDLVSVMLKLLPAIPHFY